MRIPVPFIDRPIGAGDAIKQALGKVGITAKDGCGCSKRQQAANRAVQFVPRHARRGLPTPAAIATMRNQWGLPPAVPAGWSEVNRSGSFAMFIHQTGRIMIWQIRDGQYRNSWGFPAEHMRALADEKFKSLTCAAA